MSFTTIKFILFFFVAAAAYYLLPKRLQKYLLLLAGYAFYMMACKWTLALLLFLAPSIDRIPAAALDALRDDAAGLGLTLIDFDAFKPELGIDNSTDWYDELHFNVRGAEKFSRWLGSYMLSLTEAPVRSADADAFWRERAEYFNSLCA